MKILFLSKRFPQGRDLISRPYGRFYFLPMFLASQGHEVHLLLLSYLRSPSLSFHRNGLYWVSKSFLQNGGLSYHRCIVDRVRFFTPDWIVGFSDTYYGILAQRIGARFGIHTAIDAYDNYESYLSWCKPLHCLWRSAVASADVVTAASPYLAKYLAQSKPNRPVSVIPMAPDPEIFIPLDRLACRRRIGLSFDKKIIGYCGSLHRNRDIETLFEAWHILHSDNNNLQMVISGRRQPGIRIPEGVYHLGYLPDERVPDLLNAVDVLVVPNRLSSFGEYSCPVKLYEAMQCQIPVIATRTPSTQWILNDHKDMLCQDGDPSEMASKISRILDLGHFDYGVVNTWEKSARLFEQVLLTQ